MTLRAALLIDAGTRSSLSRCRLRSELARGHCYGSSPSRTADNIYFSPDLLPPGRSLQSLLGRKNRLGNCHMHAVISIDHLGYF